MKSGGKPAARLILFVRFFAEQEVTENIEPCQASDRCRSLTYKSKKWMKKWMKKIMLKNIRWSKARFLGVFLIPQAYFMYVLARAGYVNNNICLIWSHNKMVLHTDSLHSKSGLNREAPGGFGSILAPVQNYLFFYRFWFRGVGCNRCFGWRCEVPLKTLMTGGAAVSFHKTR